ncbi:MAG: hypothetical protein SGI88_14310 [Candidatus Hydrogenedentes bacterium]|nr:hypothetical protein [Candidatus Hydrogenedentota bacterium]
MPTKDFDCVEMKNRIQAEMLKEFNGITDEEIRQRINDMLETSDSLVARKWREIREYHGPKRTEREATIRGPK